MATLIPPFITGSLFGASLLAATVHSPSIILSQLSLTSAHMLKTFLTASAVSAVIVYATNRARFASLPPRTNTSYGWFGNYDANIVGGLLQGIGMALTGACPGTVLVQVALGRTAALWIVVGGIAGALSFVFGSAQLKRTRIGSGDQIKSHTISQRLQVREETAVLGYEALLIAIVAGVDRLGLSNGSERVWIGAVQGGLLIGVAQAMSVLLAKKTLGVSSAYADLAGHVKSLVNGKGLTSASGSIVFAFGVMAGAKAASQFIPAGIVAMIPEVSLTTALVGGFCSIFGARLAGGCTSGHGISGMSTLSVSSFVTVAGMFGGGMAFKALLDVL